MTDDELKAADKVLADLNDAMEQVCVQNIGAPGGAIIIALSSVVARAIRLYVIEDTDEARASLLNAFVAAVKDCLAEEDAPEILSLRAARTARG